MATLPFAAASADAVPDRSATHRAVWRWHFYAGLFVAPVLLLLAVTGSLYLFDREIQAWWDRDMARVAVAEPLPLGVQEAAVRAAYPGAEPTVVALPWRPDLASEWTVRLPGGGERTVFVDPYRARVTGSVDRATRPMAVVRRVHGTLLAGDAGSYIVELTACWTLVMLATGVYLWWPRRWRLAGVFVPRLTARGRALWRDLHAVPAILIASFVAFLVVTGLPWSVFWGKQFARLGEVVPLIAPSPNFHAPPPTPGVAERPADAHAVHGAAEKLPWTVRHSTAPATAGPRVLGIGDMEPLIARLDRRAHPEGLRIFYPASERGVFMISHAPDRAQAQRTIYVDPASGRVLGDIGWSGYAPVAKAVEWGVTTHTGRQYGRANQLANLTVCLLLIGSVVAGVLAWWKRRPVGTLAAPSKRDGDRLPTVLIWTIGATALLFPLVGLSLVAVVVIDRSFRRLKGSGRT